LWKLRLLWNSKASLTTPADWWLYALTRWGNQAHWSWEGLTVMCNVKETWDYSKAGLYSHIWSGCWNCHCFEAKTHNNSGDSTWFQQILLRETSIIQHQYGCGCFTATPSTSMRLSLLDFDFRDPPSLQLWTCGRCCFRQIDLPFISHLAWCWGDFHWFDVI
jgi:hypothetical protein